MQSYTCTSFHRALFARKICAQSDAESVHSPSFIRGEVKLEIQIFQKAPPLFTSIFKQE